MDEFSRSTCPSIWAIGDATDRINLTPVALMEVRTLSGLQDRQPHSLFVKVSINVCEPCRK